MDNNMYQAPQKKTNVLAIVGMILGIVSIPACCFAWVGCVFGIAGLICSIISFKNGKSGMGIAGVICSILGIIGGIIMTVVGLAALGYASEMGLYY